VSRRVRIRHGRKIGGPTEAEVAKCGDRIRFSMLGRAYSACKILIRADVIAGRVNYCAPNLKIRISLVLRTTEENLVLPEEYLMWPAAPEVHWFIYPSGAHVFVRNAEHEGVVISREHLHTGIPPPRKGAVS
jgi:hypothetical protein